MKYVKAVQGTVKKGWTGTLGPKTLIVGPNMSGKSTITNTVELALTAEAYDIAGREHLQKEDLLLRHLGQDGKPLIARATFDSGEVASFEIKRSKTGASKKAEHVLPSGLDPSRLLPLRPLREAVLGLPERARRFFVMETARGVSEEDIRKRLPKALYSKYEAAIGAVKSSWTQPTGREPVQTPIDDLIAVAALSKKREREWADKSALSRSTANVIAKDVPPTEDQLKSAEKDAADAQAALEEAVRRQTLIDSARLGATRALQVRRRSGRGCPPAAGSDLDRGCEEGASAGVRTAQGAGDGLQGLGGCQRLARRGVGAGSDVAGLGRAVGRRDRRRLGPHAAGRRRVRQAGPAALAQVGQVRSTPHGDALRIRSGT